MEHMSPSRPIRLRHSLDAGRVCRRSDRPGRGLNVSRPACEVREKSGPCFSIGLEPSLVASPGFQFAATGSCEPRAEISAVAARASVGCHSNAD